MRKLLLLLVLLQTLCANAQTTTRTERIFIHPPLGAFFLRHPQVRSIHFDGDPSRSRLQLEIMEEAPPAFAPLNRYDLSTESGRYFFEKRFGSFSFPDSLYRSLVGEDAIGTEMSGTIRKDSIFFLLVQTFPSYEGELLFKRREPEADYAKGLHTLAAELQRDVEATAGKEDSISIFRILISREGSISSIMPVDTSKSGTPYLKILMEKLRASGPWRPYEAGGRKVRAYRDLYVRLLADGSYVIAMN